MLNRRRFLKKLGLTVAGCSIGVSATSCSDVQKKQANDISTAKPSRCGTRPNIIFLLTDDQRLGTLSISGHPVIKTPNIDRLASHGVRFTNAFVNNPICLPSRAAYFSSVYERVNGLGFSSRRKMTEPEWDQTYPALLQSNGYYTGFIGKFGIEYYTFRGDTKSKFDFWHAHDGWGRFFPKGQKNCEIYQDSKEEIITPIMGESIEKFLDCCPDNKPFCLSVSFSAPHGSISGSMFTEEGSGWKRMTRPANSNPRIKDHPIYGSLYRNQKIKIPEACGTDTSGYIPTDVLKQDKRMDCYSYCYKRETSLEHHYRYYQLITGIDKAVGQLIAGLKKRGLSDNTVIIFSSDHGLLMGEYGMGGKGLLYDLTTRVPFFIYDPALPESKRGKTIDGFVLNTDVAPTILSYAGIAPAAFMQGRNLLELIDNPQRPWREDVFIENLYIGRDNPFSEAVRNRKFKYIRYFKNPGKGLYADEDVDFNKQQPIFEQLFELACDPAEKNNLADNKKYTKVLDALRQKCSRYSAEMISRRKSFQQHFKEKD